MVKKRRKTKRAKKLTPFQSKRVWRRRLKNAKHLKRLAAKVNKRYTKGKKTAIVEMYIDLEPVQKGVQGVLYFGEAKGKIKQLYKERMLNSLRMSARQSPFATYEMDRYFDQIVVKDYRRKMMQNMRRV